MAIQKIHQFGGFPGGPEVKNPPCNAGDTGAVPGLGRSYMLQNNEAHAPQPLGPHSTALKSQLLSPRA